MSSNGFLGLWALVGFCVVLTTWCLIVKDIWKRYKDERAYAKNVPQPLQKISAAPTVNVGGFKMAKKKTAKKEVKKPKTKKMPVKKGN